MTRAGDGVHIDSFHTNSFTDMAEGIWQYAALLGSEMVLKKLKATGDVFTCNRR